MKKSLYLFLFVMLLTSNILNADNNQTKELSAEDKRWIEEYMKTEKEIARLETKNKALDKLNNTLDELTSILGVDK